MGTVQATTGKAFFLIGNDAFVCSASVVDDGSTADATSIVLTAGHCVYDDIGDVFFTNFIFIPDFDNLATGTGEETICELAPYGCWTAGSLVTTTAWKASDFEDDYAFAVMGAGGNSNGQLDAIVGTQTMGFNVQHRADVYAFGYPHAFPYDGNVLTYCAGKDIENPFGDSTIGLKCDMTGGSSGGPWFQDFDESIGQGTITSLNSYRYLRGRYKTYMFGPNFDDYTSSTLNAAKAVVLTAGSAANVLVDAPAVP